MTEPTPAPTLDAPRPEVPATAHHEAGHAVVAVVLKMRLGRTTIVPTEEFDGSACVVITQALKRLLEYDWRPGDLRDLRRDIVCLLSGGRAEYRFSGTWNDAGSDSPGSAGKPAVR